MPSITSHFLSTDTPVIALFSFLSNSRSSAKVSLFSSGPRAAIILSWCSLALDHVGRLLSLSGGVRRPTVRPSVRPRSLFHRQAAANNGENALRKQTGQCGLAPIR